MKIKSLIFLILILFSKNIFADEGIWIPLLLNKYNEQDMIQKGFCLSAEDVYSVNHSSLKDAVVLFGQGCTGAVVSDKGLLFTNHHCGKSSIQAHSTPEHNYLADGFWAASNNEELPCAKLTVSFLVQMEDVTSQVLQHVSTTMTENQREFFIKSEIKKIIETATKGTNYNASVKPLFYGNQYFLYVMETFSDIRLVGAPPMSIGNFGDDEDNWVWPRHAADFSVFRIYADKNNQPANYSTNNVPYHPKRSFEISLKDINENDFTMVYGFPAETDEYLPSCAVKLLTEIENPISIKAGKIKLDILNEYMKQSEKLKIQYTSKYYSISNFQKKAIGQNRGINHYQTIDKKKAFEKNFESWTNEDSLRKIKYGNILKEYQTICSLYAPFEYWIDYYLNSFAYDDLVVQVRKFQPLTTIPEDSTKQIEMIKNTAVSFFKSSYEPIIQKTFLALLEDFYNNTDKKFQPEIYNNVTKKFKGNIHSFLLDIYTHSYLTSSTKVENLLKKHTVKKLLKDPLFKLINEVDSYYSENLYPVAMWYENKTDSLNRLYMAGLMEMQKNKMLYPDANRSLRLSYGQVKGYSSTDAVEYSYFTTLDGVIEKNNSQKSEYKIPNRLKELYDKKDFGEYAVNNNIPVCFIASNHTSGGNSGSPVLNGEGQLIGLNFDRNQEGTMSDIMYNPDICRNISVDIRYCLFIIDKFAGKKYLIDEMKLVR